MSGRCKLRCEFCEKGVSPSSHEIGLADMKRLVDFSVQHDCALFLGGGEPFLHRHIWEVLEYCRQLGKKASVVTNGTLFDNLPPERFDLLGGAIGMMSVSVDSADPATHDRIRGAKGTFDKVIRFVRNPLRRNRVALNAVLSHDLEHADGMIALARQLGCSLNFQPVIFESNYPDLPKVAWKDKIADQMSGSPDRSRPLRALHRHARKLGVVTNLGLIRAYFDAYCRYAATDECFAGRVLNKFMCFVPFQQVIVNEKGFLAPCSFLTSERSISDGDLYATWRELALEHRRLGGSGRRLAVCKSCSCHFADNFRSAVLAFPLANRRWLFWLLAYYAGRLYHREGRKL